MLSINTNVMALNAQDNLQNTQSAMATSVQRLSSGLRINSAADDAAGLAISQRMLAQVNGQNVAIQNANNAVSLAQVADGALGQVANSLQRMRELAVESANATNGSGDRQNLNAEYSQLQDEIQRVLGGTQFNGTNILASGAGTLTFQVGANTTSNDQISLVTTNMTTNTTITNVTNTSSSDITTASNATAAITAIDSALDTVNQERANYGADENRFNSVVQTLQVSVQNQSSARSQIVDADFAAETSNLTRSQILQQAGTAMLAQANQLPQSVLKLLQ
ncbi:MAG TPA: flagellin [Burkholderiaceae bacterium]|nr:flagellin [Burkholderiaceae bacterium]